tara:strand:+ start:356 stop:499 length:144 start_codon:yes stop_codon:yes gene_type:complete
MFTPLHYLQRPDKIPYYPTPLNTSSDAFHEKSSTNKNKNIKKKEMPS